MYVLALINYGKTKKKLLKKSKVTNNPYILKIEKNSAHIYILFI